MIGGRFRVDGLLSEDAAGRVFRAFDAAQQAPAAVRAIPMRLLGPHAATLEADVEKASAIVHKNLLTVLMVGREADFYFIATEMMDGQSLRDFIDGKRAGGRGISFKGACNLLSHIANGLEKAYTFMPHGALNPANVWVNKAGRVKIAGLGLMRTLPALARLGAPAGSVEGAYLAPEIAGGAPPSAAGDVYAMGMILYEVLAGQLPAGQLHPVSRIAPDVPPAIDSLIERALSRDPRARWSSPMELKQALASVLASANGAAPPGSAESAAAPAATAPAAAPAPAAVAAAAPAPFAPGPAAFAQAPAPAGAAGPTTAPSAAAAAPGRLSLGTTFNVAEAAGSAADDGRERWLVHKDKLDFGPFTMGQIRAQIERGEVVSEHLIVDTETGARRKVKEFPELRDFTRHSERRLEQQRRARAEQASEGVEKRKSVVTLFIVGILVLATLGGIGFFVWSRKDSGGDKLASRAEEAEIDAFLKDVKINFAGAHVAKRGAGVRHGASGGGSNDAEFNNDANFGDATKSGVSDETLDDDVIQRVMMGNYRALVPCIMQERHKVPGLSDISLDFVVRGNGRVSAVKVNGQRGGPFASCLLGRMQSFGFPKFNGAKTIASWSMSMR